MICCASLILLLAILTRAELDPTSAHIHHASIGDRVELACLHRLQGIGFTHEWSRVGPSGQVLTDLEIENVSEGGFGTLVIDPVDDQHDGKYTCSVYYENGLKQITMHQVMVKSNREFMGTFRCNNSTEIYAMKADDEDDFEEEIRELLADAFAECSLVKITALESKPKSDSRDPDANQCAEMKQAPPNTDVGTMLALIDERFNSR